MPAQRTTSGLLGKLGDRMREAHDAHKGDDVQYDKFGSLPGGIKNGIARLVMMKFGEFENGDNKGEPYFMAQGSVVEPESVLDPATRLQIPVRGKLTKVGPIALCDTKSQAGKVTSFDEHYAEMLNELKKFGLDMSEIEPEDLEGTVTALVESGPYFRFSTRQSAPTLAYPDPRVFETWEGIRGLEDFIPGDGNVLENDDTKAPQTNGRAAATPPKPYTPPAKTPPPRTAPPPAKTPPPKTPPAPAKPAPKPPQKAPPPPPEPEPVAEFDEFGDLDSLAEKAQADDKKATKDLTQKALDAGYELEAINNADTWQDVADWLKGGTTEESGEESTGETENEETSPAEVPPKTGEVFAYHPIGKNNKPSLKPVDCIVTAVNPAKRTVSLKDPSNPKTVHANVSWDALAPAES